MRKRRSGAMKNSNASKRLKAGDPLQPSSTTATSEDVKTSKDNLNRPNPFLHSVVLRNMFEYFDVQDLKNARLVCKAWTDSASPYLQKKSAVRLYCPETGDSKDRNNGKRSNAYSPNVLALRRVFRHYSVQKLDTRNRLLSEYMEYLAGTPQDQIFHKNFIISCTVMSQQRRSERIVREFWDIVGNNIESLRLVYCCIVGVDILSMILSLPNIRSLSMENSFVCKSKDFLTSTRQKMKIPTPEKFLKSYTNSKLTSFGLHGSMNLKAFPWAQVFSAFVNLTEMKVDSLPEDDLLDFLNTLKEVSTERKTRIKHLHFTPKEEYAGSAKARLDSLKVILSNLKLESFSTQFYSRLEDQLYPNLLQLCASTLKSLTLTRVPLTMGVPEVISRQDDNFDFRGKLFVGQYPMLTHLKIFHNFLTDLDEVTLSCPNLKNLGLIFSAASSFAAGFSVTLRHDMLDNLAKSQLNSSVEDLTIDVDYSNIFVSYSLSQQHALMLKTLAHLRKFSNLKALRISLASSKEFRTLVNMFPDLEEITILENSCYSTKEEDLIGTKNSLTTKKKLTKRRKKKPDNTIQGVGAFKNLRRLNLENDNRLLTDRAVSQGFCQLDNLRYLKINNATEISFDAWGELRRLPNFIGVESNIVNHKDPFSSSSSDSSDSSSSSSSTSISDIESD